MADDCVIRVTGLKKSFPKGKEVLHVLKGINMEIRPGEVIGYLGSNGAGKSTTVKIMCGLLEDFEGNRVYSGECRDVRAFDPDGILGVYRDHVRVGAEGGGPES